MSEYAGPQGLNGVTVADRTVRQLGIEVANAQIALATQNARLEELVEVASHINFDLWEETPNHTHVIVPDNETALPPMGARKYFVPEYQADAVLRLITLLQRR